MRTSCSVSDCKRPVVSKGWCATHYMRWRRHGSVDIVNPRRQRVEPEERVCEQCGKTFLFFKAGKKYKGRFCSRECSNKAPKGGRHKHGAESPHWKGGHVRKRDGYRTIWITDPETGGRKIVMEHRLVMAKHLGRELTENETVHHKNGDRSDNRIENLELWAGRHGRGQSEAHCPTCTCFS